MKQFTKKYMVEDYLRLKNHADLLELYLYDTQTGRKLDAVETCKDEKNGDSIRVQLWRASGAMGGYVVFHAATANIWTLDDANQIWNEHPTENNYGIRICLERLTVVRNRALMAS